MFSSPVKETPYPLPLYSNLLLKCCCSSPKQPLIFLSITLFWTFHINEIIQYVVFSDWLFFSQPNIFSFLLLQHISILNLFLLPNNILFIHFLVDRYWYFSCFHSLAINLGCCYEHLSFCMDTCFHFSSIYTSGFAGPQDNFMFNFLMDCQTAFQVFPIYLCFPKCIPKAMYEGSNLSIFSPIRYCLFYYNHSNGFEVIPNWVLIAFS